MTKVVMVVHEENGRYGASFPDFPGCTTIASDPDALALKAADALAFHIGGFAEAKLATPRPRSLKELFADPQFQEDRADAAYISAIDVEFPGKAVRINISINEGDLDLVDRAAEAAGESRSGFLVNAARERVSRLLAESGRDALPANPVKSAARLKPALKRTA